MWCIMGRCMLLGPLALQNPATRITFKLTARPHLTEAEAWTRESKGRERVEDEVEEKKRTEETQTVY